MSKKFKIGLLSAMILSITTANAADSDQIAAKADTGAKGQPPIEEVFERLDVNEDGQISQEEAKGPLEKDFAIVDEDGDGFIVIEELEQGRPDTSRGSVGANGHHHRHHHQKGEKAPSFDAGKTKEIFEHIDVDSDGVVTLDEFIEFQKNRKPPQHKATRHHAEAAAETGSSSAAQ